MGSSVEWTASTHASRRPLALVPDAHELIRFATLAPSGHNTQPWRFATAPGVITLRPDFTRRTPIVDPDDHHLFVSLGCAAETLAIAAHARGLPGDVTFDARGDGAVVYTYGTGPAQPSVLCDAIPRRQSTRSDYDGRAVNAADLATLASAAVMPGVAVVLVTDRAQINRIADLVLRGNSIQMADEAFVRELKAWLRFSPQRTMTAGDGLFSVTTGNPALPEWLGPFFFDLFVTEQKENEKYARQLRSSAGLAVFAGTRADAEHWVQTGQACQRFALQATALGLSHAFMNQPVEVPALRPLLANIIGRPGQRPDLLMRFGYAPPLPYSSRRSVASVIDVIAA
jgi:nitroreductase